MSSTNISGGVELQGESINIGGDVVGRNKIVNTTIYGAVINEAPREPVIKRRDAKPQPPRAPLDFFDRANELAQVEQLITQGKPVAICGSDGAGKSALLRQAANSPAARALPDGVILLEGLDEQGNTLLPGDAIQRWFDAFYLSEPQLKVTAASAQPYLSQLRPLILLDHVALDADRLRPLLDLFPNSPALIARAAALPGLARPIKLGPLPRGDAIELFSATSGLPIDTANQAVLDAICALLNDVPLAIVRAADVVRERDVPLDQARVRLEAAPVATGDNIAVGLSRAAELIRSVLTPLEAQVLEVAANLPGLSSDPQTVADIIRTRLPGEAPTISGPPSSSAIAATIEPLKALGLLHANSPRVRLDAGLRAFWAGDGRAIRDRLLAQLLRDERAGRFADDAYCANELGHVLGAIEHAAQTQQWSAAITLSRAIDRYVMVHGLWDAWGQIADRVWQSARAAGDRSAEGWALHQLGTRAIGSDKAQAIDLLKQALSARQAIGETEAAAITQHNLDILIPPPIPPKSGEGTIGPKGMSGLTKIIFIAVVIVGVLAVGGLALSQLSTQPVTPTPLAEVIPPHTPTRAPNTPTAEPPSHTPAATRTPTETFTPAPTPTVTPTPAPPIWPIVFFSGSSAERGYEIFTINSDGSNRTQITRGLPQRVVGPCSFHAGTAALSPDGKQIAYTQYALNSDGLITSRLYLMNADGAEVRTLIEPPGRLSRPSWSPDGSRFAVEVFGERSAILIFDQSGKRLSAISLESPARIFHEVSWSPDSEMIAFSDGNLDDRGASTNIFVTRLDGSDRNQLTKNGQGAYALSPAWSPDGKRIAFLGSADGATVLHVIATEGSPLAAFPMTDFENLEYSWSPDGARLAVSANSSDGQSLSLIDVNRGTMTRLVDQIGFLVGPVWSPDGQQIAFTAFNTQSFEDLFGGFSVTGGAARSDLYVVNADGTGLLNLTNAPRQDDFTAYPLICAQCPYVYTYRADRQEWAYDTTILYQLVGKQNETLQVRALKNFDGRLLIREVEPEISHIDQLYVIVTDSDGNVHTLSAQHDRLLDADGRYVVLRTGDELLVTFEGYGRISAPQQVSVVAKGYYDPLPIGLMTGP